MVIPHGPPIVINCILAPVLRCCVKQKCCCGLVSRAVAPTQGDMNSLYDGGEFELPLRLATILNSLAMTLIFCGGIPILIPLLACSFTVSYWVDKIFILRLLHRPPNFDSTLINNVKFILPLLIVMHCLFSFWMYSDDTVYYSDSLDPAYYTMGVDVGASSDEQEAQVQAFLKAAPGGDMLQLGKRVTRVNTLPMTLLCMVVITGSVVYMLLTTVVGNLILVPMKALCMRFFCCCLVKYCKCCQAVRREYNPPLTEHFLKILRTANGSAVVDPKDAAKQLSEVQRARGWRVRHDKSGTNNYYKCRVWEKSGISHGQHHDSGDLYYTYETMDETGIPYVVVVVFVVGWWC